MGGANKAVEIREVNEAIGRRQYVTTLLYYTQVILKQEFRFSMLNCS